jgi:branched-chain amino acid transport system ATP-binding protein
MLTIENLDVYYGQINAIKTVSFEVNKGEIVTIIGANGAGKSSILRAISGIVDIRSGSIKFFGKVISGLPAAKIVSLGISQVPEGRGIFPNLTVLENLKLGAFSRIHSAKRYEKKALKDEINMDMKKSYGYFPILKKRENQYAGTLSGGEQQMLAIGRGLMARPQLLILDEPSLGLSPMLVKDILGIISEIHKSGISVLLVEQKAYLALKLTERGYVLENGRIVLAGKTDELLRNDHVRSAYLG